MYANSYRHYVLAMLTLVFTLNYLDQGLVSLLLQPIKEDLHISDTQLGFLTGIAFAAFYATLGVPVARWADRGNRPTITSVAIALWGVTVMLCVFVTNFVQLLGARMAAAVGEAGCMPPTYSLLGDYFPGSAQRVRAMSIYWLAGPLAALISFIGGGCLNQLYGWRMTFFLMGIPGLVVAVLVKLTISEPRQLRDKPGPASSAALPRMVDVVGLLWNRRSTRHASIAFILLYGLSSGLAPWYAAFMGRSHGMDTIALGTWLGLVFGVSGIIGILLGGYVGGSLFSENERGQMRVNAAMAALLVPCFALFLLLPRKDQALLSLAPLVVAFNLFLGPTFAVMQRLVPEETRATSAAVVMLLANLIGMGLGPQIVGILSDALMPAFGINSLRYAMLIVSLTSLWAAYHFWLVGESINADLAEIEARKQVLTTSGLLPVADDFSDSRV
jgi:MFS family permease